jgi:hypothetical protein
MQVNSNFNPQNQQVWRTRHQSIAEMVNDVQSGNISGAQQALGQLQQADKTLGITEGSSTSDGSTDSSTSSSVSTSSTSVRSRVDLSSLMSAVQSGDLTSAQTAWKNIQASSASSGYPGPDRDGDGDHGDSSLGKDLTSLLKAVSSGDANAMETAATAVNKDMQALFGTDSSTGQSTSTTTSSTQTSSTDSASDPIKTLMDDLNSLVSAAQKGDTTAAKTAEQKLVQDVQGGPSGSGQTAPPPPPPPAEGHHHHHHHGAGSATSTASTSTTSSSSAATALSLLSSSSDTSSSDTNSTTSTTSA